MIQDSPFYWFLAACIVCGKGYIFWERLFAPYTELPWICVRVCVSVSVRYAYIHLGSLSKRSNGALKTSLSRFVLCFFFPDNVLSDVKLESNGTFTFYATIKSKGWKIYLKWMWWRGDDKLEQSRYIILIR